MRRDGGWEGRAEAWLAGCGERTGEGSNDVPGPGCCRQVKEDFTVSEETIGVFISLGTAAVSAAGGVFMEKYLHHAAAVSSSSVAKAGAGGGGG